MIPSRGAAFVTGGSIGADTCVGLARAGFDVAFSYRNKAARAAEIAGAITAAGAAALPLQCDITVASATHPLPSTREMAGALVAAALDEWLPSGHTVVVGRP